MDVCAALRRGEAVPDEEFDLLLPEELRAHSRVHFTSVAFALRAARFLAQEPGATILDVGSGAGKFAVIGALATRGRFTGIERRTALVAAARDLAQRCKTKRATFLEGDAQTVDFAAFDGLYLYNPFGENLLAPEERIADDSGLSFAQHEEEVRFTLAQLDAARPGTRLAVLNGFGADTPRDWELCGTAREGRLVLELFAK